MPQCIVIVEDRAVETITSPSQLSNPSVSFLRTFTYLQSIFQHKPQTKMMIGVHVADENHFEIGIDLLRHSLSTESASHLTERAFPGIQ